MSTEKPKKLSLSSYCAAANCSNSRKSRLDLSFFQFPLDR